MSEYKIEEKRPVLGMILKGYPRISETFISNEILLLEQLGFKIHLFSMRHPRESFTHKSVESIKAEVDYLPHEIIRFLPLFLYHNILFAFKNPALYAKALRLAFRRFTRTRKSATIKHLLQAGLIAHKLMPGKNIVHLHAHFAHSPTSVAMFTSLLAGIDFSFTGHAKDIYTSDPKQLQEKIEMAKFVVTCTGYNQNYLESVARGKKSIHAVYHGIDLNLFQLHDSGKSLEDVEKSLEDVEKSLEDVEKSLEGVEKSLEGVEKSFEVVEKSFEDVDKGLEDVDKNHENVEQGMETVVPALPETPWQLFTVARMVRKKGLPTVYKTLAILKDRGFNFRHTLVGDGDDREKILALIKDLNLAPQCRWLGTLTHEEVIEHYRKSHAFILGCEVAPNGDRDGIPNVFVESMAMGVPVVSTTVSAIPEIIINEKTGLMVAPAKPDEFADAVQRIMTDGALRDTVIKGGKKRVKELFDNKRLIEKLAGIYLEEQPLLSHSLCGSKFPDEQT
ncbi:Glycosyl transferase group 1 [Desulfamplus magnetovallimortis]|uniref:Glycosyl transferase group 1 n=1 Tax=Desulfamplus magnetovallimortis TaxID=1246637 RepID=A0A1W1H6C8_9BACT|nr:glycosyltransferase family 4 protein [Desulfamplus magnetovallimortis]SLM28040.1 Glycosyl transferase group 1 [Desulfamplus magnetovallimortis]